VAEAERLGRRRPRGGAPRDPPWEQVDLGFDKDAAELTRRGHENVSLVEDWTDVMGHAQAIRVFSDRLEAAADPRGDGAALGL